MYPELGMASGRRGQARTVTSGDPLETPVSCPYAVTKHGSPVRSSATLCAGSASAVSGACHGWSDAVAIVTPGIGCVNARCGDRLGLPDAVVGWRCRRSVGGSRRPGLSVRVAPIAAGHGPAHAAGGAAPGASPSVGAAPVHSARPWGARAIGVSAMDDEMERQRERRLRDRAAAMDLALRRSPCREPRAHEYGTYGLSDAYTSTLVAGDVNSGYGMSLDDVERALDA